MLDINEHHDQGCMRMDPALLFSAAGLKQSVLTARSRRHFSNQNNGKYIDRRSKDVVIREIIMNDP